MNFSHLIPNAIKFAKANVPEILTAASVTGVIATGYFAAKGAKRATEMLHEQEEKNDTTHHDQIGDWVDIYSTKKRLAYTYKCYIPAVACGALTITGIFGSNRASGKRTAAAVAAYLASEKTLTEYREKVVDEIGKGRDQKIRDKIVEENVHKSPPKEVFLFHDGEVLCRDELSGRYFKSNMETLCRARNEINHRAMHERYVTVDEFYDEIGLAHTDLADKLGWDSDRLMELEFTSVLTRDGQPCLAYRFSHTNPL